MKVYFLKSNWNWKKNPLSLFWASTSIISEKNLKFKIMLRRNYFVCPSLYARPKCPTPFDPIWCDHLTTGNTNDSTEQHSMGKYGTVRHRYHYSELMKWLFYFFFFFIYNLKDKTVITLRLFFIIFQSDHYGTTQFITYIR